MPSILLKSVLLLLYAGFSVCNPILYADENICSPSLTQVATLDGALEKRALIVANGATLPAGWSSIGCYLQVLYTPLQISKD